MQQSESRPGYRNDVLHRQAAGTPSNCSLGMPVARIDGEPLTKGGLAGKSYLKPSNTLGHVRAVSP